MSWQVRREGSPTISGGLTANQIVEGLNEGVWEPTDEVRGPKDERFQPLEAHPFFAEALAEYEPPRRGGHDVEEHLDMNPLIDVALVLLIFFILTTSYDALRKVIDMPSVSSRNKDGVKRISVEAAKAEFVIVKARPGENKQTAYEVDEKPVEEKYLQTAIEVAVNEGRNKLIMDVADVSWESVVKIIDAGKAAKVTSFKLLANSQ